MRRTPSVTLAVAAALASLLALSGCGRVDQVRDAREILGTVVNITAYPAGSSEGTATVTQLLETAYTRMAATEPILDAYADEQWIARRFEFGYNPQPSVAARSVLDFNTSPFFWRILPLEAEIILGRIDALGVEDYFSAGLLEVSALYSFEDGGTVPDPEVLAYMTACAETLETRTAVGGTQATFDNTVAGAPSGLETDSPYAQARAGLDLGGAHKGYALDQAIRVLSDGTTVSAALVTAGSTTVTTGKKPDNEPWLIGVEDPRNPEELVATVEARGAVTVSTSGDYQRYFERDGVRYHHILDPATGLPARGLRSLTVVGARSALDSDILATALFVMGSDLASRYAEENGLGLVLVDDEGRVRIVPGPEDRSWEIVATR